MSNKKDKEEVATSQDDIKEIVMQPKRLLVPNLENISELRQSIGLSQREFSDILGVSPRTLEGWEQKRRKPTGAAASLLAAINTQSESFLPEVTLDKIELWYRKLIQTKGDSKYSLRYVLEDISYMTCIKIMGIEWVERIIDIDPNSKHTYFSKEHPHHIDRIVNFANLLLNCQNINGFFGWIQKFKTETLKQPNTARLESAITELTAANYFSMHGIPVRFNAEKQVKGQDYDLEVQLLSGIWIPCEVKTKLEDTKLSKGAIVDKLKEAKKQTPEDEPCIAFLKLPGDWLDEENCIEIVENAIKEVLRNTEKISLVMMHFERVYDEVPNKDTGEHTRHIQYEVGHILNDNAKYPIGKAYSLTEHNPQWRNLYDLVGYWHDPDRKTYFSYVDY